jgi:hypothetical protein
MWWEPRRGYRWPFAVLIAAAVCALFALALVAAEDMNMDESAPQGAGGRPTKMAGCPGLAEPLWRVSQSDDSAATATALGVPVVDDRVRVIAELEGEQDPPPEMPGIIEARYLQFVQVLIEPGLLCSLASTDGVVAVTPPFQSAPAGPLRP